MRLTSRAHALAAMQAMIGTKVVLAAIAAVVIPMNLSGKSNGASKSIHTGYMPGTAMSL